VQINNNKNNPVAQINNNNNNNKIFQPWLNNEQQHRSSTTSPNNQQIAVMSSQCRAGRDYHGSCSHRISEERAAVFSQHIRHKIHQMNSEQVA
jgi:hypothetical protein